MSLKHVPFQIEKTVPGTFLMQGLLGGVLGGFVAGLIGGIVWGTDDFWPALNLAYIAVYTGGIVGVIKSPLIWGAYRLSGVRMTAITRVTATSIVTSLLLALIGRQYEFDEKFLVGCLVWALTVGIPVALLVGSSVKPWELFTFGSIAAGDGSDRRLGSRSILRTLCTFPLRFLSIGTILFWLLCLVPHARDIHPPREILGAFLFFLLVAVYPFFSAFVTFRSPRKTVLLACGVILNIPIALIGLFCYGIYDKAYWLGEFQLLVSVLCGSFLAAWLIFLIARLSVTINPAPSLSISNHKSIAAAPNLDHECLGSRFVAWQHHEA
jgi:hypothetical protein